jgi:hypothetical protein
MPDHIDLELELDTDLKTSWNISDDECSRQISQFGYDCAAAAGLEAMQNTSGFMEGKFRWVFAETVPPFDVRSIYMEMGLAMAGKRKWREANRIWAQCLATGIWPGQGDKTLSRISSDYTTY